MQEDEVQKTIDGAEEFAVPYLEYVLRCLEDKELPVGQQVLVLFMMSNVFKDVATAIFDKTYPTATAPNPNTRRAKAFLKNVSTVLPEGWEYVLKVEIKK